MIDLYLAASAAWRAGTTIEVVRRRLHPVGRLHTSAGQTVLLYDKSDVERLGRQLDRTRKRPRPGPALVTQRADLAVGGAVAELHRRATPLDVALWTRKSAAGTLEVGAAQGAGNA